MLYKNLCAQNPDRHPKLWQKLDALYRGGFHILEHAEHYLPQAIGEHPRRYRDRVGCASYVNYLSSILDSFSSQLFGHSLVVMPAADADNDESMGNEPDDPIFWAEFGQDADLKGGKFTAVVKQAFETAALKCRALVGVDFPRIPGAPANRSEEDAMGAARAYCYEIPLESLIDWEYASVTQRVVRLKSGDRMQFSVGKLSWAIVRTEHRRRETPEDARGLMVEEFKVWRMSPGGFATWELYRTPPRKEGERVPDDLELPIVDGAATSFREIPILELCLPDGLWIGNKAGPIALEHFQRRTSLIAAENRSLFAIPVAKLGSETPSVGGALPSQAQENPDRGNDPVRQFQAAGFMVMGADDGIEFAEPSGACYALVDKQLAGLIDEMYRVVHQMAASVSSTSTAAGRSGDSKKEDRHAETVVLEAMGEVAKDFATRIYGVVSEARGESVVWTAHGLDGFDKDDRAQVLEEAVSVETVQIPSKTFRRIWLTKIALALIGRVEPATQRQIAQEIEEASEHPPEATPAVDDEEEPPASTRELAAE